MDMGIKRYTGMRGLLHRELLMTAVIDRMDAMVRVLDEEHNIIYMNEKMRLEFGNHCGRVCYQMLGQGERCIDCVTVLANVSEDSESKEITVGEKIYRIIASSVKLEGLPRYSIEFFVDITKQRKLEEANRSHFARLAQDVEFAKQVQYNALPKDGTYFRSLRVHSIYRPAESLAGDFFDVVKIDEDRTLFYIADVAGHGVRSSLLTIFLHQVIRGMKERAGDPRELINGILQGMNDLHTGNESYLTILVGIYDRSLRELTLVNAGHNCLPLLEGEDGELHEVEIYGMPVCSLLREGSHTTVTRKVRRGQRLLMYTDGVTETENLAGEAFGVEGILRLWDSQEIKTPQRLVAAIQASVVEFAGFAPKDDMTAVLIEFL